MLLLAKAIKAIANVFTITIYQMTMCKQCDNVKGAACSDKWTENLCFMDLDSEFQCIGQLSSQMQHAAFFFFFF